MKKLLYNIKEIFHVINVARHTTPKYLIVIILKTIIISITPFVNIIFTNIFIDKLINKTTIEEMLPLILIFVGINFLLMIFTHIFNYNIQVEGVAFSSRLSQRIALKSFNLNYEQMESHDVLKMIKQAEEGSNSSGDLTGYLSETLCNLFRSFLILIYSIILLIGLSTSKDVVLTDAFAKFINTPYSFLIIIAMVLVVCLINIKLVEKMNKKSYETMLGNIEGNRRYGYFYRLATEYKYGKDVRIFRMQPMIIDEMTNNKNTVDHVWGKYVGYEITISNIMNLLNTILAIVIYIYVGLKGIYGIISIGNVVAYATTITLFSTNINSFVQNYAQIVLNNNYLSNYFNFLSLDENMIYGEKDITELDFTEGIDIKFNNVTFTYPNTTESVLKNISFHIHKKERIAIVGLNGAGKTTIVKLLCRLYSPTEGEILINDININEFNKQSCYALFSVVFQDFKLYSYSIKDNVSSGSLTPDVEKIKQDLNKAGLEERIKEMPNGIDTILYQNNRIKGVEISGGEAQKIAIARALYKDSPVIVLDEPTAALDPKSEAEIYEKFYMLVENKTAIFISHRMSSCMFCDQIMVVSDGIIAEKGTHHELLNKQRIYNTMWEAQAKYYL